jgi:hypothetical protein
MDASAVNVERSDGDGKKAETMHLTEKRGGMSACSERCRRYFAHRAVLARIPRQSIEKAGRPKFRCATMGKFSWEKWLSGRRGLFSHA